MKYNIETILSITHNKLLTDLDSVYQILNFMLDDNLFTHQLPRACRFAKKFILAEYSQLDEWELFDKQVTPENYKQYIEKAKSMFGEELEIHKVASGVWTYKSPMEELKEYFGEENIIEVQL